MLRPIGKNVLVKEKPVENKSKVILTAKIADQPFQAVVEAIGDKCDMAIKVGDVLLLIPYAGSKISKEEDGYLLISERDVLGVVCEKDE